MEGRTGLGATGSKRSGSSPTLQSYLPSAAIVRDPHYLRRMVHGVLSGFQDAMPVRRQFNAKPFLPFVSHDPLNAPRQIAIVLRKVILLWRRKTGR